MELYNRDCEECDDIGGYCQECYYELSKERREELKQDLLNEIKKQREKMQ